MCSKRRSLAKAIVRSTATYIGGRDETCNAKLVFALKQAIEQLPTKDEGYAECIAIMQKLQVETWQFGVLVEPMSAEKTY